MSVRPAIFNPNNCSICREDYEKKVSNACLLLKCGHIFHEACVGEWIEKQNTCPACRSVTFIPMLLKDIILSALRQGAEGAKRMSQLIGVLTVTTLFLAILWRALDYAFPGRWPSTDAEVDDYIKEHGVLFDLRTNEGYVKLGTVLFSLLAGAALAATAKSLSERRNQPAEVAKRIDYIPEARAD